MSKGAPLRALSIITGFWILGRIIWELGSPAEKMLPIPVAEAEPGFAAKSINAPPSILPRLRFNHGSGQMPSASPKYDPIERAFLGLPPKLLATATLRASLERPPSPVRPNRKSVALDLANSVSLSQAREVPELGRVASLSPSPNPISGYFWAFGRQDSGSAPGSRAAPLQSPGGQYGGNQAGAILTYRMMGSPRRNLSAFVRASTALSAASEEEVAIGIKAKPWTNMPIALFVEQRVGATKLRDRGTAFYVAGGTGPDMLIANTNLETYGQAGFLMADDSSYFFDGSATLQRKIWDKGNHKITAGAGVWAGGQEGVTRVDIGPRVNADIPIGGLDVRFSLDWRKRIGGNAVPNSGVAVTMTTGF